MSIWSRLVPDQQSELDAAIREIGAEQGRSLRDAAWQSRRLGRSRFSTKQTADRLNEVAADADRSAREGL